MSGSATLTSEQLRALVSCGDVSENVHAKVLGFITNRGGIDDAVLQAARAEIDHAGAKIRLLRTILGTPMFDPIRAEAERMIDAELAELEAIVPELIESHRASIEQQAAIAKHLAEVHRIEMEGAMERHAAQRKLATEQAKAFDEQMARDREAANKRHELFMQGFRGSRY